MDNPIRVTIDSPRFADPSLMIRVAVLLEKALNEELAKIPPNMQEVSSVDITVLNETHASMLQSTRQVHNELAEQMLDIRPLQVEIIVL